MSKLRPNPAPSAKDLIGQTDWPRTALGARSGWGATLRTAVDIMLASPLPMALIWGGEATLLYNDAFAAFSGRKHPAAFGSSYTESWPELRALYLDAVEACRGRRALSLREEHLVLERNGFPEDVWLDLDASPVLAPDGEVLGVLSIVKDVTLQVLSEWRQREAEAQLAEAIEAADLGTWDINIQTGVWSWSRRAKAMFGIAGDAPFGPEDFAACLHPDDRAMALHALAAALDAQAGAGCDVEFRTIGRDDSALRWVAIKGRAHFDAQGQMRRCSGTVVDVTARQGAERRQACLVELGDCLRRLDSTEDIAREAARLLGAALGCARAGYAVIRGDVTFVEADWTDGDAVSTRGPRAFASLGEAFCAPLLAGDILVIDDVKTHPATQFNAAAFRSVRIGALINVPLMESGVLSALAYAQHTTAHHWSDDEIGLVKDVADRTWEASGRAKAVQALRKLNASLEEEISLRTTQRDRMWRLSSDLMLVADFNGMIDSVNPAWTASLGWQESDLIGRNLLDLAHPNDRAAMRAFFADVAVRQPVKSMEGRYLRRDGGYVWLSWRAAADANSVHAVGRDINFEREQADALRAAEEALRQSQKMEAVGQLTGGIAHDFNNLLQGITGSLDLVEKRFAEGRFEELGKFLSAARKSASRAAGLTHRLLAFSRRQPLDPKPLLANPLVASMEELLRRTMGERIEISIALAPDLWLTLCDPNQLESAILNLAINARDAMPDGGGLVIETCNTRLEPGTAALPDVRPGEYVCIGVTDTGTGMAPSVLKQAFEPFYTTKPIGQGTGLGLSMIYGFAKQSGGYAQIISALGEGTTVRICLPRFEGAVMAAEAAGLGTEPARLPCGATVLVVEDEPVVRDLVLEVLHDLGLNALEASSGTAGLEILQSRQAVDLLVTDIGLPGLNGRQMADAARLLRPRLKILFMTGYAENATLPDGVGIPGVEMITKPFLIDVLAARVSAMLDAEDTVDLSR